MNLLRGVHPPSQAWLYWFGCVLAAVLFLPLPTIRAQSDKPASTNAASIFDIPIEDLTKMKVVGVSKREETVPEAPSTVTVVTAEEIKRYGYRTLAEILQSAPGLSVSYDRNDSFLGIRGFNRGDYNNRVLLLVDGHRVNNNLSDGGAIGTDFILDPDLIDKVEIIRGPGAALYGNNAFFGVVNVRTRRVRDLEGHGGAEASATVASFDTYQGRVTYGHQFKNGLELLFSGTLYDSQGPGTLRFNNVYSPGTPLAADFRAPGEFSVSNGDYDNFKSFFGTVAYRDFTLQGAFLTREKGDPTAPDLTAYNDRRTRVEDDRSYVSLKYDHEFPDVVQVVAQVYYDRYDLTWDRLFDVPPPTVLNREIDVGEWWGAELQLNKRLWDRHLVTLGAEYRDDFRQFRQTFNVTPPSDILYEVNRSPFNYGVYLNSDFEVLTNLHLHAGARYDQYSGVDPAANPRVALIYNPLPKSALKFIYGSAFRAPNFFERTYTDPDNPKLDPETITTYELVYEQVIGIHLRSSVSGYYNQIDHLITVPPGGYAINLEGADAKGVELAMDGRWPSGLQGRVSYALQQTEDRQTHQTLTDSPRHLGKLNVSVPLKKDKVFASVEFQYASGRTTWLGTEAPGFGTVNLTLFSRRLVKGLELSASVYNLLDKKYSDPASTIPFHAQDVIEQDGRTFRAKLTYRF